MPAAAEQAVAAGPAVDRVVLRAALDHVLAVAAGDRGLHAAGRRRRSSGRRRRRARRRSPCTPPEPSVTGQRALWASSAVHGASAVSSAPSSRTTKSPPSRRTPTRLASPGAPSNVVTGTGGAPPYFEQATSPLQPSASTTETFEADAEAGGRAAARRPARGAWPTLLLRLAAPQAPQAGAALELAPHQ